MLPFWLLCVCPIFWTAVMKRTLAHLVFSEDPLKYLRCVVQPPLKQPAAALWECLKTFSWSAGQKCFKDLFSFWVTNVLQLKLTNKASIEHFVQLLESCLKKKGLILKCDLGTLIVLLVIIFQLRSTSLSQWHPMWLSVEERVTLLWINSSQTSLFGAYWLAHFCDSEVLSTRDACKKGGQYKLHLSTTVIVMVCGEWKSTSWLINI